MKVLVTGGTGYIGSHTVVELQSSGYTPIVVDSLVNSDVETLTQIEKITGKRPEFHQIDLCNHAAVKKLREEHPDIKGLIHFAALKAVGESVEYPVLYYQNNLSSLLNVLDVFSESEIDLVFSSSCTVYGQPDRLPVSEQAPLKKPESPYGSTKQMAEQIIQDWVSTQKEAQAISLRYFNPVGAHESALIGELPRGTPQNLVPYVTQSARGKRGPITIFGNDYDTPDGTAIRDYIHVVDLAKAHVAALAMMEKNRKHKQINSYDVFNIGTGKGHSVLELIKAFEKTTGVKLDYTIGPRRPGDITQVWSDVHKSTKILGWKATRDLETMMESAWAWENYLKETSR